VPQPVAQLEKPPPIIGGYDRAVLVEIREITDAAGQALLCGLGDVAALLGVRLTKIIGEYLLLLVCDDLVAKDQDGILIHPGFDRRNVVAPGGLSQVNRGHFSNEDGMQRPDGNWHDDGLLSGVLGDALVLQEAYRDGKALAIGGAADR